MIAWKLIVLTAAVFAVAALRQANQAPSAKTGYGNVLLVAALALAVWALGALAATRFV